MLLDSWYYSEVSWAPRCLNINSPHCCHFVRDIHLWTPVTKCQRCGERFHGITLYQDYLRHYSNVRMSVMPSQITGVSMVYWAVYSGADKKKHQSFASLAFVRGIHRWPVNFPHKRASNAENVSIWWRHHVSFQQGTGRDGRHLRPVRRRGCVIDGGTYCLRLVPCQANVKVEEPVVPSGRWWECPSGREYTTSFRT